MKWKMETEHAAWDPRDSMGAAVFQDRMWILGGWRPGKPRVNDVWCSDNGVDWNRVCEQAPWKPRNLANTLVFQDRLWIMGGGDRGHYSDVWRTDDGAQWECVCENAPWGPRACASAVVFAGAMWILGGLRQENNHYCDVWRSADGVRWEKVLDGAPWGKRGMHTMVVFQDQMVLMAGGQYHNPLDNHSDVWYSPDGIHWTAKAHTSPWYPRRFAAATVGGGQIWLAAGWMCLGLMKEADRDLNDVWRSVDGAEWQCITPNSEFKVSKMVYENLEGRWRPRHAPGFLTFQEKVWILGGGMREFNDVWSLALTEGGAP